MYLIGERRKSLVKVMFCHQMMHGGAVKDQERYEAQSGNGNERRQLAVAIRQDLPDFQRDAQKKKNGAAKRRDRVKTYKEDMLGMWI